MNDRFADTSGWASWVVERDPFHNLAVDVIDDTWGRGGKLVTTNWVLAELTALLASPFRLPKPVRVRILTNIRFDPGVTIVNVGSGVEADAWDLWESRLDKE